MFHHRLACLAAIGILILGATAVNAAEKTITTAKMPLDEVQWMGHSTTWQGLKGKTVVVLVYATWCPKCNKWSSELFRQLKASIEDKPVVVLALNADEKPDKFKEYVTQRNFIAPNILHGYAPQIVKRLELDTNLFQYVFVDPTGNVTADGPAGTYQGPEKEGQQKYVLPLKISGLKGTEAGEFQFFSTALSQSAKAVVWPMELGVSQSALTAEMKWLRPSDREMIEKAVDGFRVKRLAQIQKLVEGDMAQRLEGHEKAAALATICKNTEQGREAKKICSELEQDQDFKQELSAKKAFDRAMKLSGDKPTKRQTMMKAVAKKFEGTCYGERAQKLVSGGTE